MLLKAIFGLLLAIPKAIISLFPSVDILLPDGVMSGASTVLGYVGYFLPIKGLLPIIVLGLALDNAQLIWAIVLRIKSFIPTMGA